MIAAAGISTLLAEAQVRGLSRCYPDPGSHSSHNWHERIHYLWEPRKRRIAAANISAVRADAQIRGLRRTYTAPGRLSPLWEPRKRRIVR